MPNRTSLIVAFTSVWLGLLTVICVYSFFGGNATELRPVRRRHLDDSKEYEQRTRISAADQLKLIVNKLKSTSRRNSLEHVIFLSSFLPPITNVSRMPTPSSQVFCNYISPVGLPVIFTDMLLGTKLENWSWDMVKDRWGNHIFHNTRQGNYSKKINRFGKHRINRVSVKLSRFVDLVTGTEQPNEHEQGLYITKQKILPPEALDNEFYYPPFYPGNHRTCFLEPTGWYVSV